MKKIIVFLEKMVEDSEFQYPYLRLKEEGFDVVSVAPEKKSYQGKAGQTFMPDKSFEEVKDQLFDAVFVPGGYAPDMLRRDEGILNFIKRHHEEGKLIASVCHGPWVLISAGIVKDRKVTGFFAIKDDLINAGAIYEGKDWVEDGNLITSTNPKTMLPMMKRMVEMLRQPAQMMVSGA
jgi:protease I